MHIYSYQGFTQQLKKITQIESQRTRKAGVVVSLDTASGQILNFKFGFEALTLIIFWFEK